MDWHCIHCETANQPESTNCSVCNTERYYSTHEITNILKNLEEKELEIQTLKKENLVLANKIEALIKKASAKPDIYFTPQSNDIFNDALRRLNEYNLQKDLKKEVKWESGKANPKKPSSY